jgi:16S rRNA (cytosine1402-N4)-methyltransferase
MTLDNLPHKRRVRYKGTHPRSFEQKYKELDQHKYSSEIAKVMQRGQTPAGMHRPICVQEIVSLLAPAPGMVGLDATLGYGGHAQELLKRIVPQGMLIGIDADPIELPKTEARLRALGYDESVFITRRMNYAGLAQLLPLTPDQGFDFILADLGVSSMQLDTPSRGFTYKADGPLDLRLNPARGQSAEQLLKKLSQHELEGVLVENADEVYAPQLAEAIHAERSNIPTTTRLAQIIRDALRTLPKESREEETKRALQRTFQALRIAVNDEFGALNQFLGHLDFVLKPGGKIAILTFHSGEDRRVKKVFVNGLRTGIFSDIARRPIRPSAAERHANPRSSCAKLRWAIKSS